MEQLGRWLVIALLICSCRAEDIHTTKVFIMTIEPSFLNWTDSNSLLSQNLYIYRPSLLDAPDLPSWMYYTYSQRSNRGFIYGSPPLNQKNIDIEVIGLNRNSYETRRRTINMNVIPKTDAANYEVHLKVDKLNVNDMLDSDRYNHLLGIFRNTLWPNSHEDLYITFLASAVELGARLPLKPYDGEGIIIHIGSRAPFSQTLLDLEKEVRPLRNKGHTNCPDFKHTSVERFFKQYNFSLDWCAFELTEVKPKEDPPFYNSADLDSVGHHSKVWQGVSKQDLPTRDYVTELALTLIAPVLSITVLVGLITLILCCQRDSFKRSEDTPHSLLVQYEAVQRTSNTLRSLSTQRENEESSPRVSMERSGLRPQPPPYAGVHQMTRDEFFDDEEAKTWYC